MKKIIVLCTINIFVLTKIVNISTDINNLLTSQTQVLYDDSGQLINQFNQFGKNNGRGNTKSKGNTKEKDNKKKDVIDDYVDNANGVMKGWQKKILQIQQGIQNIDISSGINPGIFKGWMKKYLRTYQTQEQPVRLNYFSKNLKLISKHNSEKLSLYQMQANKFTDLSDEQFLQLYFMSEAPNLKISMTAPLPKQEQFIQQSGYQGQTDNSRLLQRTSATTVDWRQTITFAPIKDQGKCAACYAFANIAAVELNKALKLSTKRQPMLSEQQIVDCCKANGYRCNGCTNGNMGSTFDFLADKGIATTQSYPYTSIASSCRLARVRTSKYLNIQTPYYQMVGQRNTLYYLINSGPLAVAADGTTWKFYKNGIFDGCKMDNFTYTHAIVLIGVDKNYWLVRNSWGADWGQNGYIKIKRGDNPCGILNYVFLPNIA